MKEPDRVAADLREYEHQQDIAEFVGRRADEIAKNLADDLLADPVKLCELVADYEIDIWSHLARVLSNINLACEGEEIARAAVLQACSNIQRAVRDKALDQVAEGASENAWAEHRER